MGSFTDLIVADGLGIIESEIAETTGLGISSSLLLSCHVMFKMLSDLKENGYTLVETVVKSVLQKGNPLKAFYMPYPENKNFIT